MERSVEEEVVIVGAGIAGLATAVALKRIGVRSLVLEKSDRLRTTGAGLTLGPNAWRALDAIGVSHKLTPLYASFSKGYVTDVGTGAIQEMSFVVADGSGAGPRTVHRKTLLQALADELPSNSIRFSSNLTSIRTYTNDGSSVAIISLEDGTTIKAKVLIGCDGVHSVVARWLGLADAVDSGRLAVRGMAVFPEGHGLKPQVQQFLQGDKRAGFVPLSDKELYWFLTWKSSHQRKGMNLISGSPEEIQREVLYNSAKDFPPVYKDVVGHSDIATLTCAPLLFRLPWHIIFGNLSNGTFTVAGDAMHPMVPDLGQGGCCALEDAVVLARHIGESVIRKGRLEPREAAVAIEKYIKERRWRTARIVTASYISGWMQLCGSSWWMKFLRDGIFYRHIFSKLINVGNFDCGKLPKVPVSVSDREE